MRMKPGALIVFEGLDKTGKTMQRDLLVERNWDEPAPAVFHMPSGQGGEWPADVYAMLEASRVRDPVGEAAAAPSLPCRGHPRDPAGPRLPCGDPRSLVVVDARLRAGRRRSGGTDRCRRVRAIGSHGVGRRVRRPGVSVLQPHEDDVANRAGVGGGYRQIAARDPSAVVEVSAADPDGTHAQIIDALAARGLLNE